MTDRTRGTLTEQVRRRLIGLAKAHGLTQTALARASGERQQDISRFFIGEMVYPPLEFLDGLARVFGLTLADVVGEGPPARALREDEVTVLATWNGMAAAETRAAWLQLLRQSAPAAGPAGRTAHGPRARRTRARGRSTVVKGRA